ncbi:MAG: hypothetical protein COA52_20045, partial [Hyphomicrobiales bacterium]
MSQLLVSFSQPARAFFSTKNTLLSLASALLMSSSIVPFADAATIPVTTAIDDGLQGSLSWAIEQANNNSDAVNNIRIDTNVTLTNDMPLVNFNKSNKTTNIIGNGNTINGGGNRIFFVDNGVVNMDNLDLVGGAATGGTGGNASRSKGSGGGAG